MIDETIRAYAKLEKKLRSKITGIVKRGVFSSFQQGGFMRAQSNTYKDETRDDVEVFEQFGFTSQPPNGSEGLLFGVGGDSSHPVAINIGNRGNRVQQLQTGETCVYSAHGSTITLLTNGEIVLTPGPGAVIRLGGDSANLAVARETDPVNIPSLQVLQTALNTWVPVAMDGGAALKTALVTWLASEVNDGFIESGGQGSTST